VKKPGFIRKRANSSIMLGEVKYLGLSDKSKKLVLKKRKIEVGGGGLPKGHKEQNDMVLSAALSLAFVSVPGLCLCVCRIRDCMS
jgi:hypothetical protein